MRKFYTTGILAASLFTLISYGQISAQQKTPTQNSPIPLYESQFKGDLHTIKFIPHLSVNGTCLGQKLDEYAKEGVDVYVLLFDKNGMLTKLAIKPKGLGQKNEEEIRKVARECGTTIKPNNNLKKKNGR